jgi:hypothetical protein
LLTESAVSSVAQPKPGSKSFPLPALWIVVVAQIAGHLALLSVGGWISDTRMLQTWAARLFNHPVSSFYASDKRADHLPGDLWILRLEASVYHLISGHDPSNAGFLKALKLGPGLADVGLAVVLYLIASGIDGRGAGRRAALLFALNPAPFFISMVWGVADSASMFFAALALLLAVRGWFWAAMPALTYACLIKPQLGILAPLLLIFFLHEAWRGTGAGHRLRTGLTLAVAALGSIAVLLATLWPFHVGLPLMQERWSLFERISVSANLYKSTTMNALNLWALLAAHRLHFPSTDAPSDQTSGLFGLSYQHWAIGLTAIACVILSLPLIRKGGAERLVWTCAAVSFAFFMLQTRIHERYFFPAIALTAVAAALRPRLIPIYVVLSGVYFANVWWVYRWLDRPFVARGRIGTITHGVAERTGLSRPDSYSASSMLSANGVRALVGVNLAVLGFFIVRAILDVRKSVPVQAFSGNAAVNEPDRPYPEWPALREYHNQHPI